jgi:hypothetical protein
MQNTKLLNVTNVEAFGFNVYVVKHIGQRYEMSSTFASEMLHVLENRLISLSKAWTDYQGIEHLESQSRFK